MRGALRADASRSENRDRATIERARVLDLIQRDGWNATAFQTLESGYSYFFHGDDACVAYTDTGSAWVAAGAPIAAHARIGVAAAAFSVAARAAGKRCCFFATDDRFRSACDAASWHSTQIGEQPVWNPHQWRATLAGHKSLREQLRRARAKGVAVRKATAEQLQGPLGDAVMRVVERWLNSKSLAPMAFLVRVELLTFLAHRSCFVAEIGGRLIAVAGVIPVPARGGWFLEDLVRSPDAPNGTAELLVDAVMNWAAAEGCDWLTLGLAPLAGDVTGVLRLARARARWLYDFEGVRAFKAKLRPQVWLPIHLSYPVTQGIFASHFDALAAFATDGFLRFGLRSALLRARSRR